MEMNERGYKIKGPHWNALHCYSNGDLKSKFIPTTSNESIATRTETFGLWTSYEDFRWHYPRILPSWINAVLCADLNTFTHALLSNSILQYKNNNKRGSPSLLHWISTNLKLRRVPGRFVPMHFRSREQNDHIVDSTQLNSTENYGRRCLTPLSPHRNYILS